MILNWQLFERIRVSSLKEAHYFAYEFAHGFQILIRIACGCGLDRGTPLAEQQDMLTQHPCPFKQLSYFVFFVGLFLKVAMGFASDCTSKQYFIPAVGNPIVASRGNPFEGQTYLDGNLSNIVSGLSQGGGQAETGLLLNQDYLLKLAESNGFKVDGPTQIEIDAPAQGSGSKNAKGYQVTFSNGSQTATVPVPPLKQGEGRTLFRAYWGTFDKAGLLEKLTSGQLNLEKGGSQIAGFDVERIVVKNLWDRPIDVVFGGGVQMHTDNKKYGQLQADFPSFRAMGGFDWHPFQKESGRVQPTFSFRMGPLLSTSNNSDMRWAVETRDQNSLTPRLLNAVRLDAGLNEGRLFNIPRLENCSFGVSAEHASGAFGLFDGVTGGWDYSGVYHSCSF